MMLKDLSDKKLWEYIDAIKSIMHHLKNSIKSDQHAMKISLKQLKEAEEELKRRKEAGE